MIFERVRSARPVYCRAQDVIDHEHQLSISRQAKLLGISRGSVSDQRRPSSPADLALMHRMDALHVEYPFAGSRMLRGLLRQEGFYRGPPACRHADEADGDDGALSASDHVAPDPGPPA